MRYDTEPKPLKIAKVTVRDLGDSGSSRVVGVSNKVRMLWKYACSVQFIVH